MSYTIRTCKECGQKVHIRQKGNLLDIKNRCVHFNESTISRTRLEELAVSTEQYSGIGKYKEDIPDLCVRHGVPMIFKNYITDTIELHHCPGCAVVGKLIPAKHIKRWKKQSHTNKWTPGDVKLIIVTNYKTMMERGWTKHES